MEYIIVFITVPNLEVGEKIGNTLVEEKLAACVNIIPEIKSVYFWKGNVENDNEHLLIIKTRKDKFKSLEKKIKEIHPYEVPEIVAIPIVLGSTDYLNWIDETLEE
ncbi:MAG TPA: divalent-cation tolerance protein CutA [Methanothermococcus okinawensis]|uniref:Periplasmic divalent cation tolerance protein n=1 Tax=Methanofervidicoccus abyssi TaxID=2082189 RepID=A0A401HPM3_9EURY|nr:divalent-cation tolerance protein CutA [Methanofervidicoccus abyssi]GBF36162.1 periplasmic divalent cation tolerance protein [Methanofervidicoccus abyssi]HIP16277.1 divalent-cation tolerance protein CutA [Methanothermococcus okinawensis]